MSCATGIARTTGIGPTTGIGHTTTGTARISFMGGIRVTPGTRGVGAGAGGGDPGHFDRRPEIVIAE